MTSANDKAILNSIFNPLLPVGECVFEEDIPEHLRDDSLDRENPLTQIINDLEVEGVRAAERGDAEGALLLFEQAIGKDPKRASCYNNRAQTLRLFGRVDEAVSDLDKAIELSGGKGKSACQAFVQRALIRRLRAQEDPAEEDFRCAAALGSEFAKAQLVQMNPYAAMCNKMLHDVFTKLRNGEEY